MPRQCSSYEPCEPTATSTPTGAQPKLTVNYSPDLGEKGFYSTTDHKLNDRTSLKVNNDDGNVVVKADDITIPSLGQDLDVSRYYNSLSDEVGAFGPGWSLSVGPDVRLRKITASRYEYDSPSGAVYGSFVRKSDTTSSDPNAAYNRFSTPHGGVGADLVDQQDGSFTLRFHKSQTVYTFRNVDGGSAGDLYLVSAKDRSGNTITYSYATGTHQLSGIIDASGHTVTVRYSTGSPAVITSITEANGPTTRTWPTGTPTVS